MAKRWVDGSPDKQLEKKIFDKEGKLVDLEGKIVVNGKPDGVELAKTPPTEEVNEFSNKKRIEEHRAMVETYNTETIWNVHPRVEKMTLLGTKVLVRFQKLHKYNENGIYMGELMTRKLNRENVVVEGHALPQELQVSNMAAIVKVGEDVTKVKEGQIGYVNKRQGFEFNMRYMDQYSSNDQFDNYYMVDERDIEWVEEK